MKKVQRQAASLRHQVQDALRSEIVAGHFKPGERLVEQQLCAELEVSRTSIREALRQLEAEGLVEQVPHRGSVVATVSKADALQIYEVRGSLEVLAVRNFIRHATRQDIDELRGVLSELAGESDSQYLDGSELLALKKRFYQVLLDIEQSRVLRGLLEIMNNRVSLLRALSMGREGRAVHTIAELGDIVSCIESRDEAGAAVATVTHVENALHNVLALLDEMPNESVGDQ